MYFRTTRIGFGQVNWPGALQCHQLLGLFVLRFEILEPALDSIVHGPVGISVTFKSSILFTEVVSLGLLFSSHTEKRWCRHCPSLPCSFLCGLLGEELLLDFFWSQKESRSHSLGHLISLSVYTIALFRAAKPALTEVAQWSSCSICKGACICMATSWLCSVMDRGFTAFTVSVPSGDCDLLEGVC